MRRLSRFAFIISLLLCTATAESQTTTTTFTVGKLNYQYTWGNYCMIQGPAEGYEDNLGDLVIPAKVEYDGEEYEVSDIEEKAFYRNTSLTSLEFEGRVNVSTRSKSFWFCTNLKKIILPPEGEFEPFAFSGCNNIDYVFIPKATIPFLSFVGASVKEFDIEEGNKWLRLVDGILCLEGSALINKDEWEGYNIFWEFPGEMEYKLPDGTSTGVKKTGLILPSNLFSMPFGPIGICHIKHIVYPSHLNIAFFDSGDDYSASILCMDKYAFFGDEVDDDPDLKEISELIKYGEVEEVTMPANGNIFMFLIDEYSGLMGIPPVERLFVTCTIPNDFSDMYTLQLIPYWLGILQSSKKVYAKKSFYDTIKAWVEADMIGVDSRSLEDFHIDYKIPFTMNSSGYATFCRDFDVNFNYEEFAEDNADLKVYVASSVADTVVTLKEIGDKYIPSRTGTDNYDFHGVLLKGTPGKTYYFTIGEQDYASGEQNTHEELMSGNLLVGCPVETYLLNRDEDEQAVFVLKNGKFQYLLDDMGVFSAQKAYLSLPRSQVQDIIDATRNHQTAAGAKLAMRFENADGTTETDGIEQVAAGLRDGESDALYDLQGRRVETVPSHGIYVRNGQKVMIK